MAVYSFLNVVAAISGPGGAFNVGSGSGNAEEGISTSMIEEKDLATFGADGALMHTLRAANGGKMTLRFLKTAPANALLSSLYNFQKGNPVAWGANVITVQDVIRGDVAVLSQGSFMKQPDVNWKKDGDIIEWEFVGIIQEQLGIGVPDANA